MNSYDFIGCARRMGAVLIGRTEPSVTEVHMAAMQLAEAAIDRIGIPLKRLYDETLEEGVPLAFANLIATLPESLSDAPH